MRNADGSVKQSEIRTHVSAGQGVGQDGERQCQHGGPCAAYQQERYEQHIRAVYEIGGYKSDTAQHEAQRVNEAAVFEHGDADCPKYGTDSLYGKQYAYPVGSFLILQAFGVENYFCDSVYRIFNGGSIKYICGDASVGVCPHEHKGEPAEELHQPYRPKGFRCFHQQLQHIDFLMFLLFRDTMIFGILCRRHFLDFDRCINNAEYQNGGSDIERVDYRIGNYPLGRRVADTYPRKYEREQIAHQAAGIA